MSEGEFEAANSRCKRVKTRGGEGGGRRAAGWLAGVDRTRKKERKKVGKSEDGTGRREGPYLNDIVAGVHTRRLPLIAPLKRPCYLAGGTTEREDPPSRIARVCVYICIHTHDGATCTRVKEGRSVAEKACVREEDRGGCGSNEDGCIEGRWREKDGKR